MVVSSVVVGSYGGSLVVGRGGVGGRVCGRGERGSWVVWRFFGRWLWCW